MKKFFLLLTLLGICFLIVWTPSPTELHLESKNLPPSFAFFFGTDWLGRSLLDRSSMAILQSLRVGLLTSTVSASVGLIIGLLSGAFEGVLGVVMSFVIDLFLSLPHLVLLILLSFIFGGGVKGVVLAIGLTHWPKLASLIRSEVIQIKKATYIHISAKLGHPLSWRLYHHYLPVLAPQLMTGLILLFPQTVLHEAALTFLGLGLPPHLPGIGTLLAESIPYLSLGYWWSSLLPGVLFILIVKCFEYGGALCQKKLF